MNPLALDVVIEIPSWSFRKTSFRAGTLHQEFFSLLPCPFNYGHAPAMLSADGSGQDVIVIGQRLQPGTRVRVVPRLRVVFLDQGLEDDKLVGRLDGAPLRWTDHAMLRLFFTVYSLFKRARYRWKGKAGGQTGVVRYAPI